MLTPQMNIRNAQSLRLVHKSWFVRQIYLNIIISALWSDKWRSPFIVPLGQRLFPLLFRTGSGRKPSMHLEMAIQSPLPV